MGVYRTKDMAAVSRILNHPKVFRMISEDFTPKYVPKNREFYIMNDGQTGVVRIDPFTGVTCSAHIATLPELWGKGADFTTECLKWGFKNTTYNKVVVFIPEFNRLTISLCKKCGFEQEGKISHSFILNWKYHDMIIMGITKTRFLERRT